MGGQPFQGWEGAGPEGLVSLSGGGGWHKASLSHGRGWRVCQPLLSNGELISVVLWIEIITVASLGQAAINLCSYLHLVVLAPQHNFSNPHHVLSNPHHKLVSSRS